MDKITENQYKPKIPSKGQGILIDCSFSALKKKIVAISQIYGLLPESALKSSIKVMF